MPVVNKNAELLRDFAAYCKEHPEQRFWQALTNWADVPFLLACSEFAGTTEGAAPGCINDTFYCASRYPLPRIRPRRSKRGIR